MPFNSLNSTEFNTFSKFDIIETQKGSNKKLTPTPTQIIIDKLNNLIQQQNFVTNEKDNEMRLIKEKVVKFSATT